MTSLHEQTLASICRDLKSGAVSAEALTAHMLARIKAIDGQFRAFVMLLGESALAQARERDRARAAGAVLGPLHGVPIAIKDLLTTKGIATSCGTRVLKDWRPDYDATVVERLQAAGAVIIGKVKLTEGAYSNHHPDVVVPVNPFGERLWTGVSSSGSGVAVAARECFAAIGTDTGGSIRFPSASCGVVGIKPTYGLVSRYGAFPLADSLDHVGPMARCVEDAARVLAAIAGFDPKDPTSLRVSAPTFSGEFVGHAKGLRVGFDERYCQERVDPQVASVAKEFSRQLAAAGATIVQVEVPPQRALVEGWAITCSAETALAHAAHFPSRRNDYGPELRTLLDLGGRVTATQYAQLERERERFRFALEQMFQGVDLLIAPAMPMPAPTYAELGDTSNAQRVGEMIAFTAPYDYSGHPTITLPMGVNAAGAPLAMQLIAPLRGEAKLIRGAFGWEAQRGGPTHYARPQTA